MDGMTVAQITQVAELYCGRNIENDIALQAINQALMTIGDLGLVMDTEEYLNSVANRWEDLPDSTTGIVTVEELVNIADPGDPAELEVRPFMKWKVRTGEILFQEDGDFQVVYRRMPAKVVSISEVPDAHPIFHRPVALYLQSFVKTMRDDNNPDGHKLMEMFYAEIQRSGDVVSNIRKR